MQHGQMTVRRCRRAKLLLKLGSESLSIIALLVSGRFSEFVGIVSLFEHEGQSG